jgi:Raf kinase inhibitor-like YbhB/YbcL family protein
MDFNDPYARFGEVPSFTLTSEDASTGQPLAAANRGPSHGGTDTSPQLSWSGFPAETKSFAVTCFDPDAPTGSGFWHWSVYNIPATVTSLAAGAGDPNSPLLPTGAATVPNEFRTTHYIGSAPPEGTGTHRYFFVVHALDVETLELDPQSTPAILGFNMHFHTLARAVIVPISTFGDK